MAVATAPAAPPPPTLPPRSAALRDRGPSRRDLVWAQAYDASGAVRIAGDLDAPTVTLEGLASVGGKLVAEHLRASGRLDVAGDVRVKADALLKGATTVGGRLDSGDLASYGTLAVAGAISANGDARVRGRLDAPGPFTARSAGLEGIVQLPGAVESPYLVLKLHGRCRIGTLQSEHVRILRPFGVFRADATLLIDRIEATEVDLAHVDCEYLRAERIRLGPGCRITELDGKVSRRHRTASVGPRAISERPYGLTR